MPALINEWTGNATEETALAQLNIERAVADAIYEVAMPFEHTIQYRATASDTRETIAAVLAASLESWKQWKITYVVGSAAIILTGSEAGVPLTRGLSIDAPAASFVRRLQAGLRPVAQSLTITLPETTIGGTWSLALDFGSGDETASALSPTITPSALATAIDALATPTSLGGGVSVKLLSTSPRQYLVTLEGDLATGTAVTYSANATALTGNASVEIETTQTVGGNANELQASFIYQDTNLIVDQYRFSADGGVTFSDWTFDGQLTRIQTALDSLYGSGVVTAARHENDNQGTTFDPVLITFTFTDSESHTTIVTEARSGLQQETTVSTIQLQAGGGASANEFQVVNAGRTFAGSAASTYTLSLDGNASSNINPDSLDSEIITALDAMAGRSSGDWIIHRPAGAFAEEPLYIVEMDATIGDSNESTLVFDDTTLDGDEVTATITVLSNGGGTLNEIQSIVIQADGGTLTYSHDGNGPSAATNHDADDTTTDTRLESLLSIGSGGVSVTGSGTAADPFLAEFIGANAETDMALISADDSSLLGGLPITFADITAAVAGQNEIQEIVVDRNANGGTLRAGFGPWSDDVAYDATPATWQTAIEDLSTIGSGNVSADGIAGNIIVEFLVNLGWLPQSLFRIDQGDLTLADFDTMGLDVLAVGSSNADYSNEKNWSLEHVPNSGEAIVFGSGKIDCQFGLVQRSEFTVTIPGGDTETVSLGIGDCDLVDGQTVRLRTTDTFPSAQDSLAVATTIDETTDFVIVSIDYISNTLILSESDGTLIYWTDAGTGTHTVEVQAASILQLSRYSGKVGRPRRTTDGLLEWLPRYLAIGVIAPTGSEDTVILGQGDGDGSPRLLLDLTGSNVRGLVMNTGSGIDGNVPAVLLLLDHSSAELHCLAGEIGVAMEAEEESTLSRVNSYDADVILGNVTVANLGDYNDGIRSVRSSASGGLIITEV